MGEADFSPDRQLGSGIKLALLKDSGQVGQLVQAVGEFLRPVLNRLSFEGNIVEVNYGDCQATDREPAHEYLTFTLDTGHKLRFLVGKPGSTGEIYVGGSRGVARFQGEEEVWIVPEVDPDVAFGSRYREQPRAWIAGIPEAHPAEGESSTIRTIFTVAKKVMAEIKDKPPSAKPQK